MSTPSNPLVSPNSGQGFFGKIGSFLRQNPDAIQDIGDHLAAAFGNYAPMQMTRQRRADLLRAKLDQSQMETATLNRQFLQKQIDDYQTPDQQQSRAIDTHRAETPQQYVNAEGGIGVSDYDIPSRSYKPRMVTEGNPEYGIAKNVNEAFEKNFPGAGGVVGPPTMPSTMTHPVTLPSQVVSTSPVMTPTTIPLSWNTARTARRWVVPRLLLRRKSLSQRPHGKLTLRRAAETACLTRPS